jgi:N6-adenosine-specific RNA methylase IME4
MIERMFPEMPRLEMFARVARPGLDVWGNEAPANDLGIPAFLDRTKGNAAS